AVFPELVGQGLGGPMILGGVGEVAVVHAGGDGAKGLNQLILERGGDGIAAVERGLVDGAVAPTAVPEHGDALGAGDDGLAAMGADNLGKGFDGDPFSAGFLVAVPDGPFALRVDRLE